MRAWHARIGYSLLVPVVTALLAAHALVAQATAAVAARPDQPGRVR